MLLELFATAVLAFAAGVFALPVLNFDLKYVIHHAVVYSKFLLDHIDQLNGDRTEVDETDIKRVIAAADLGCDIRLINAVVDIQNAIGYKCNEAQRESSLESQYTLLCDMLGTYRAWTDGGSDEE